MKYSIALEKATEYFNGDRLAAEVFLGKYALTTPDGDILEPTPELMHRRLAKEFARIEAKYPNPLTEEEIFKYLDKFKYIIPQGSPMAGIGNPYQIMSISNCFVIDSPADSYGGILKTDQEEAQIMKRRGGCLEAHTRVYTQNGLKFLKDVEIGENILSYNVETQKPEFQPVLDKWETKVSPSDRIVLKTAEGMQIKTSRKHPILTIDFITERLVYKQAGDIKPGDYLIKSTETVSPLNVNNDEVELGWFIGAYMGSAGWVNNWNKQSKNLRLRILGNNREVIRRYGAFVNKLLSSGDSTVVKRIKAKRYKAEVFEYTISNKTVAESILSLIDYQTGVKCHSNFTPSIVRQKNLWLGFIAGLIDTTDDGTVRPGGTICIEMCAEKIIDDIASWLSVNGVDCRVSKKISKRINEKPIYRLTIRNGSNNALVATIMNHVSHEEKKNRYLTAFGRDFSTKYPLFESEIRNIINSYNDTKYKKTNVTTNQRNNLSACIKFLKDHKTIGLSGLNVLKKSNLLSQEDVARITQRVVVENVSPDLESEIYYDLTVKNNNNYFAGNFGMVVDHNCGFDISTIRPRGTFTNNAAKTTDGIGVFMERFSNTCREVAQGGRRGALMLTISVHHPEIETFINIKRDLKKVTGANISVRLTDEFMKAVESGTDVELRFPVDSKNPVISSKVDARKLWTQIIESAHASAEPGLLFWDTIDRETPTHCYSEFKSISTNPCGEIVLSPYDSCRLLLVNALSFVKNPFTSNAYFDYESYGKVVQVAQRLMDDIVDLEIECIDKILQKIENDPESEEVKFTEKNLWIKIKKACINGRRTGLGLTAIGDMIAAMGLRYGDSASIALVDNVYRELAINAYRSTVQMAKERGPFPVYNYDLEKDHTFLLRVMNQDPELKENWKKYGRRNIALTTTAPAGSVSVLTQTTSGIEPVYLVSYKRRRKINPNDKEARVDFVDALGDKWQEYEVYHHQFKKWMEVTGKTKVQDSPYYKATASDIDWVAKVKLQAAAQKWICHSISNTTNIPAETTIDVVKEIYMTGWKTGCKGVTIYRDGCRSGVLVSENSSENKKSNPENILGSINAPKRPKELICDIHQTSVKGEKWTFFVGLMDGKPYEILGGLSKFVNLPKKISKGKIVKHNGLNNPVARYDLHYGFENGHEYETIIHDITNVFENATYAAFTRTISLALRHGTPVQYVVEQLLKGSEKDDDLFSFSRAVTRVLKHYIKDGTKASQKKCLNCGSSDLIYQEGCVSCKSCGHSKCG